MAREVELMRIGAWLLLAGLPVLAACQQEVPKARQPGYYLSTETPPPAPAAAPAAPPRQAAKLPVPRKPQPPAEEALFGPAAMPATADAAPPPAEAMAAGEGPPPVPATADAGPQPVGDPAAAGTATLDTPAPVGPGQGTGSAPVPVPPAPGSEDVASLLDPGQLVGLDLAAVTRLLGQPAAQSERPPAKVWSYNGDGCSLRVFVYPDINTRLFRALTYDIQGTDGSPVAKRRCFTGLVKQHAT
ncbi:MAG: hypothetical protein U1E53_19640 [Dongiaceae bacterium]